MMKHLIKRILSVILMFSVMISVILSVSSCNRRYDEEEVESEARDLLRKAELLNEIYYGNGIRYIDTDGSTGYYKQADTSHLEELGFTTLDGLMALTEQVYSEDYASVIYSTVLSSITDDSGLVRPTRYYQAYDEDTGAASHIMVYSAFEVMMKDSVVYDYNSLHATHSKKEKVYVSVMATVTNSDGESQEVEIIITMFEEEYGWRIDGPTYANYNPYQDLYNDLKDNDLK